MTDDEQEMNEYGELYNSLLGREERIQLIAAGTIDSIARRCYGDRKTAFTLCGFGFETTAVELGRIVHTLYKPVRRTFREIVSLKLPEFDPQSAPVAKIFDDDVLPEIWSKLIERAFGLSAEPANCVAFSEFERMVVARSMRQFLANATNNLVRLRRLRYLYQQLLRLFTTNRAVDTPDYYKTLYCKDGILIQQRGDGVFMRSIVSRIYNNLPNLSFAKKYKFFDAIDPVPYDDTEEEPQDQWTALLPGVRASSFAARNTESGVFVIAVDGRRYTVALFNDGSTFATLSPTGNFSPHTDPLVPNLALLAVSATASATGNPVVRQYRFECADLASGATTTALVGFPNVPLGVAASAPLQLARVTRPLVGRLEEIFYATEFLALTDYRNDSHYIISKAAVDRVRPVFETPRAAYTQPLYKLRTPSAQEQLDRFEYVRMLVLFKSPYEETTSLLVERITPDGRMAPLPVLFRIPQAPNQYGAPDAYYTTFIDASSTAILLRSEDDEKFLWFDVETGFAQSLDASFIGQRFAEPRAQRPYVNRWMLPRDLRDIPSQALVGEPFRVVGEVLPIESITL